MILNNLQFVCDQNNTHELNKCIEATRPLREQLRPLSSAIVDTAYQNLSSYRKLSKKGREPFEAAFENLVATIKPLCFIHDETSDRLLQEILDEMKLNLFGISSFSYLNETINRWQRKAALEIQVSKTNFFRTKIYKTFKYSAYIGHTFNCDHWLKRRRKFRMYVCSRVIFTNIAYVSRIMLTNIPARCVRMP